ncbi:hypothetical protein MUP01_10125 [Candidatus Bathyarchaeota archaeon]|nr:hypothetical protein [Candidatus Bathyarchaeota archaeon]
MDSSEPNLTKTVYAVIWSLHQQGVFSPLPENVMIERTGGNDIYPCGRGYGAEGLDLSQLKWAANEGRFWFNGPVRAIKIIMDKGLIQGDLRLEINRMSFATSLNTLNYRNFEAVARKLKAVALQNELKLSFQQSSPHSMTLLAMYGKPLSAVNATEFIKKIHILHESADNE